MDRVGAIAVAVVGTAVVVVEAVVVVDTVVEVMVVGKLVGAHPVQLVAVVGIAKVMYYTIKTILWLGNHNVPVVVGVVDVADVAVLDVLGIVVVAAMEKQTETIC